MSEPIKLSGNVDFDIRFEITDLVALVLAHPKEWRALTKERLKERGGYGEEDRLAVFLDDYIETRLSVYGDDGEHIRFTIDWNDTDYNDRALDLDAFMASLPPELRFEDGELEVPEPEGPIPMEGDQPLPGLGS